MGLPYRIIVEEKERSAYEAVIDCKKILVLDPLYQKTYNTFDSLGDTKSRGPGPARNFAWDHAIASGYKAHWVMDDNIKGFFRFNRNLKVPCKSGAFFRAMEDFVGRYSNVAMSGPNYFMFCSRKAMSPPFVLNTRIYSCNLIRNDLQFRWRGRYNEDTDLSIRMLKAGWVTIQFNAFLQYKMPTQSIRGGNTDEFYRAEGTAAKSQMIVKMHPDVARLTQRFGRIHHYVDYKVFSNPLRRRPRIRKRLGVNNYGMVLRAN